MNNARLKLHQDLEFVYICFLCIHVYNINSDTKQSIKVNK